MFSRSVTRRGPTGHTRLSQRENEKFPIHQILRRALQRLPMAHRMGGTRLFKAFLTLLPVLALFLLWDHGRGVPSIRLPLSEHSEVSIILSQVSLQVVECVKSVAYLQHHFLQHVNTERFLNAVELQHHLRCVVERGTFRRGRDRDIRSTKHSYKWFTDPSCSSTQPPSETDSIKTISQICDHLQGKRLFLVGDRVQYSLHNLILHRFGADQGNALRLCAGAGFCNWHQICPQVTHPITSSEVNSSTPPYDKLMQYPLSSSDKHTIPANWSHVGITRYAQSTTLLLTNKRSDRRLNDYHIPSSTDVRENESFWRFWLLSSDITVLSKGPVPAPAWSWKRARDPSLGASDRSGFALRPVRDAGFSKAFQNFTMPSGRMLAASTLPSNVHMYTATDIIEAATRATVEIWLPAAMRTLSTLRDDPDGTLRNKVIVWRGEWFAQGRCNQVDTLMRKRALENVLGLEKRVKRQYVLDPWLSFHNVQGMRLPSVTLFVLIFRIVTVLLQSLCLQQLLPYFDITYLPHYMHLAPFRHGLLADCLSINPTAPDRHIDEVFLRGLLRVMNWKSQPIGGQKPGD